MSLCTLYPFLISNIQLIYPNNIQLIQLLYVCKMLHSFVNQYISSHWLHTMGTDVSCIEVDDIEVFIGTKFLLKF